MFPQNLSEIHGALAVSDLVRILLSCNVLVRLQLMAPNSESTWAMFFVILGVGGQNMTN
jgi:hypothetical protein